jgi:hypothetical protein
VLDALGSKILLLLQICAKGGEQARAVVEIFERQQFVRRVHVTQRDGNQTGSHPAARELHRVGIGASAARGRGQLMRNLFRFSRGDQQLKHARVYVRTAEDHRPFANVKIAGPLFLDTRRVGAVRDIKRNAHVRFARERARGRSAQPDFFLDGRDTDDASVELAAVKQAQRFGHNPGAHFIVERHGNSASIRELEVRLQENSSITDRNNLERVLFGRGADVDVEVMNLRNFLFVLVVH